MKIALVLDRFNPSIGGLERWAFELVRWLSDAGHEVHVVATEFREPSPVPPGRRHGLARSLGRLERAAAAAEVLRSLAADIVHDTGTGWDFDVFHPHSGSRLADRQADLRAEAWYRRPLRAVRLRLSGRDRFALEERQLGAGRAVIVACSRMVRDDLERLHGVDPARIRVVPNGVDTDRFHPRRRRDRAAVREQLGLGAQTTFLIAAHNWKLKGVATAIRALGALGRRGQDATLVVAGRGDTARYRRLAARAGVGERCRFLGPVDDLAPYYAAADVYLQPTFYDPCSLTVLEAWASGLPVITSRMNGAAELATAGREVLIVEDPSNVIEVASSMRSLLDAEARAKRERPARALAEANSLATSFGRIVEIYDSILERRRREVAA